jgi:hypothetical protein
MIGKSEDVLVPGGIMKKKGWKLPPGEIAAYLVDGSRGARHSSGNVSRQRAQRTQLLNKPSTVGTEAGADTVQDWET